MIRSFADLDAEELYKTGKNRKWNTIRKAAFKKLYLLDAAQVLDDLKAPPGNRLEALKGNRSGQYSIRINAQFRLCFIWTEQGATHVEIVDYH